MKTFSQKWKEADFEKWFVENQDPRLPSQNDPLLIISREKPLRRMIDITAIDSEGGIVIVEVKNERSTREAVGQSLEYLALYRDLTIDELARQYADYTGGPDASLRIAFQKRFDKPLAVVSKRRRICIVAPSFDLCSAACTRYLGQVLLPGEAEYHLLCADKKGKSFQLTPYTPPDLVHTTKMVERQFAISPTNWTYLVLNAGPTPVLWKIGKRSPNGDLRLLGKGKTLTVAKRWLAPIDRPTEVDDSLTGTCWVNNSEPNEMATVIGVVTPPRARGHKSHRFVVALSDGKSLRRFDTIEISTFRRLWHKVPQEPGSPDWNALAGGTEAGH